MLRVRSTVRGRITTHSGLGDLLLDPRLFYNRPQSWSGLSWREHHSLQQLLDGMDGFEWSPPPYFQVVLADLPAGLGRSQCAQVPSLFQASGEDLRPGFDSDFQRVDFGPSFRNESSSALWLTFVTDKRVV